MKYKESWSPPISDFRRNFLTCDMFFELWPALKSKPLTWFWWIFFLISEILLAFLDVGLKNCNYVPWWDVSETEKKSLLLTSLHLWVCLCSAPYKFFCYPILSPPPALGECPNTLQQNKKILYFNGTRIYGTNNSTATFTNFSKNTALTPWRGGILKNDHIQEKKQKNTLKSCWYLWTISPLTGIIQE